MNPTYSSYREEIEAHGVPVLGYLAWYFVGEGKLVAVKDLHTAILESGAPISLPKPPRMSNVFRRACTAAERKKVLSPVQGEYYNYMVRKAGIDDGTINVVVVQERVDAQEHKLGFITLGDIVFDKNTHVVHTYMSQAISSLMQTEIDTFTAIGSDIVEYMEREEFTVTPYVIRESLRHALEGLHGSLVRPGGGIYFLSSEHEKHLHTISEVVDSLPKTARVAFHFLPLVDDAKQREMVKEAFIEESVGATHQLMADMGEALQSGEVVSAKRFLTFRERYSELYDKMQVYQKILEDNLDSAHTTLELCSEQLVAVIGGTVKNA